jgi:transposase
VAAQKKSLIAREQDAAERATFQTIIAALDPTQVVVLDETSTPTALTPLRARAPRGERAVGAIPKRRWTTITLLATMTLAGMGEAVQFPGALDREVCETFIEQWLVPTLHPGQIISWDNLSVHKSARARQLIEAAGGQLLPTPRYSPDCNPIEQAFSKLKTALRRAEARTVEAVVTATGEAFTAITPADARSFFAAAGYPVSGQPL